MKTIGIKSIKKKHYDGVVFNLELESNFDDKKDDLFWIEQGTGIVTHNCWPKDVNAIIYEAKKLGCDLTIMEEVWRYNLKNRKDINWAKIKGAVSEK